MDPAIRWPALPYTDWAGTCTALHLWTQIVGKVRLRCSPWLNHSWHATLYVSARGLTTGPMHRNGRMFEIEFDVIGQRLVVRVSDGRAGEFALESMSVAEFHQRLGFELSRLDLSVPIHLKPNEVDPAVPFPQDTAVRPYDPAAVQRFWLALIQIQRVFTVFRAGFLGKCSPAHLFWGSFDLAVTRFSGRTAPVHLGGVPNLPDVVTREAYSHEVSSAGFWPGGPARPEAIFYSYAYPAPEGFAEAAVRPAQAAFDATLGEFVLSYDAVRGAADPDALLLEFLHSTYAAAADLGAWPRHDLERPAPQDSATRP